MRNIFFMLLSVMFFSACHQTSFDEQCQKEAQMQTQKICPRGVAEGVTLDSIVYDIPNHTMGYYYTMSEEFDNQENIDNGKEKFREALKNQIRQSIDLKKYKDHDISFRYIYFSASTGKLRLEEMFTKEDYK